MRIYNTANELHTMIADYKGAQATVNLTNGHTVEGALISINSVGLNVKDANGKTISRALSKVDFVDVITDDAELDEDTEADMLADMIEEGVIDAEDDDIEVAAAEDGIAHTDLPENTDSLDTNADDDETPDDDAADDSGLEMDSEMDALVAELDGCTTKELAEVFGIEAKELRVKLRALGMGVGKGHRYHLTADQVSLVKNAMKA